jgi:GH43 family beta-xylosidase
VLAYKNPVYDKYMADPFVLQHDGRYYAYGTGPSENGKQFPLLFSADLVTWESKGNALVPPPDADEFWAPEVAYQDGTFYMYYSAHGVEGRDHQLRVAMSRDPLGPFEDSGRVLTPDDPFTIDAHPFRDVDGQWYLFYARDFLTLDDEYRVGTGIVVDRLIDMVTLEGKPRMVIRPHADWHLFRLQRSMYGSIFDWYTIEGPAMRIHNGKYYCFYSGGAWEHDNYGISYAVADHPLGPYQRPRDIDGPILRSVPGQVIGPGHNSFTLSPGGEEYAVYHGWDAQMTARLMRIDRLRWQDDQPIIEGPT